MEIAAELELIERAKAGDTGAQAALLHKYDRFLWKVALKRAPNPGYIEDFKQQATIYLLEAIQRFDPANGVRPITYFYNSVGPQLIRDYHRTSMIKLPLDGSDESKQARERMFHSQSLDYVKDDEQSGAVRLIDDGPSIFAELESQENVARVQQAIAMLPERDRDIMRSRLAGLTMAEIGGPLGLSKARIGQLEQRSLERLKDLLSDVHRLDLPRIPKTRWQPVEIQYLRSNYRNKSTAEISDAIGRGPFAVVSRITKLGLQFKWTASQDRFLRNNAENGWGWCAEQLGRTPTAIHNRVRRLTIQNKKLKAGELERLRQLHAQGKTNIEIGRELGVTDECVRRWLNLWKLPMNKRDERKRVATLEENLLRKYGVRTIREAVTIKRVAALGCLPGMPFDAALTLVALENLARSVDKWELAKERAVVAAKHGWKIKENWRATLCGAKWLREHGRVEVSGGGNTLLTFSLLQQEAA